MEWLDVRQSVELCGKKAPNGPIFTVMFFLFDSEEQGDERCFGPVQKSGGHAVMLKEKHPLPFIDWPALNEGQSILLESFDQSKLSVQGRLRAGDGRHQLPTIDRMPAIPNWLIAGMLL